MSLVDDIKTIQRAVGARADGVFGPVTAGAVLEHLRRVELVETSDGHRPPLRGLDERTLATIATLDPKAQELFLHFALLAKATAATLGCDYVAISGHRSWGKQEALYKQANDGKDNDRDGKIDEADETVTKARGGYSSHNFGIAVDFAVFYGKTYADAAKPELARRVHAACAVHAKACGLEWGGDWKRFVDPPHYQVATGLTLAQKRKLYQQKGSVL